MKNYESVPSKCPKMAALSDPDNGGSPGDGENARAALERMTAEHSITADTFDPAKRKCFDLLCVSRRSRAKNKKQLKLVEITVWCLSPEKMATMATALNAAKGDEWRRKAGCFDDGKLMEQD